jgi:nitrogen regulatory protein P-II 2
MQSAPSRPFRAAQTGKLGHDKIFVFDLEQAVRIRTGETGPEAL